MALFKKAAKETGGIPTPEPKPPPAHWESSGPESVVIDREHEKQKMAEARKRAGWPENVPPATLEAAVEVAALLIRREGRDPDGAYLLRKCGQVHVDAVKDAGEDPDKLASWACSEARRRSLGLNHKAIVAQRIA